MIVLRDLYNSHRLICSHSLCLSSELPPVPGAECYEKALVASFTEHAEQPCQMFIVVSDRLDNAGKSAIETWEEGNLDSCRAASS